ncbi:unnamed protein product [Paramecium primaurelia]|uniref:Uncharacterized protein n=1 Tax=Paramecium primaurelia TaxID=5886 RepID=A0A8S1ME44_PARPR|nr:unnamed protein product [Paramecium primaurelia]
MNQIILISIIISITQACSLKQLRCEDLFDQVSCQSVASRVATCFWNTETNQCIVLKANCNYYNNKDECNRQYECGWNETNCQKKMMEKQEFNCEYITSYESCVRLYDNTNSCTWEHNKCISISKCSEINDFMQCRNSRLKEKCQLVINGKSSSMEKQYFYYGDLFDEYECRAKDCKYNLLSLQCPNFVNGRRCFQYFGECTQCSYFTNKKTCLEPNQCTWENGNCRNILCSDLKGKEQCQSKPFCQFNDKNLLCETRIDNKLYCYAYDISSDPIKSKKKLDI